MTHKKARKKLKRYYRIRELAQEILEVTSNDIIVVVGVSGSKNLTSMAEAATIRKVDLLASTEYTENALKQLPETHRQYIELRYDKEMSVRAAGRELFMSKSSADRFEDEVLSAYISALGYVPLKKV